MCTGAREIHGSKPIFTYSGSWASSAIRLRASGIGDDDQPDAAEASARRLPAAGDDPLDRLPRNRLVGVAPHHLPATENVGKLHAGMITVTTLTDGGQDPLDVAQALHDFLAAAQYVPRPRPLRLPPRTGPRGARRRHARSRRCKRGVAVRIVYNADFREPIPVPPPPKMTPEDVARLGRPVEADRRDPDLMHHKYVVRDRSTVWTGSTNWTDDSWSREENVIAVVDSPELARAYTLDFEQLWTSGSSRRRGRVEPRPVHVDGIEIGPWFCPGYGDALSHRIAKAIGSAKRRVRICSPVITAAPVLAHARAGRRRRQGRRRRRGRLPQVEEVQRQWATNGVASWKLPLCRRDLARAGSRASGRRRGARATVHDYMHAKITVADDVVFLGSFNLSHSGERTPRTCWRSTTRPWRSAWPGTWTPSGLAIPSRASDLRNGDRESLFRHGLPRCARSASKWARGDE